MSNHNIGLYEDLTKIIFQLSSNMHLISSSAHCFIFFRKDWGALIIVDDRFVRNKEKYCKSKS